MTATDVRKQTPEGHHAELLGRIRDLMEQRGVTDEELVEASGVPRLIESLRSGKPFSSYELACIAEHFGVPTMFLITGDERTIPRIIVCNLDHVFGPEYAQDFTIARDYRNADGIGYVIEVGESGYRWSWTEAGETDLGEWVPTLPDALRSAADNWVEAGDGGNRARILRAVATREERRADKQFEISS